VHLYNIIGWVSGIFAMTAFSENEKLYPETNNLLINVSSGKQYSFICLNKSTGSSPIYWEGYFTWIDILVSIFAGIFRALGYSTREQKCLGYFLKFLWDMKLYYYLQQCLIKMIYKSDHKVFVDDFLLKFEVHPIHSPEILL